MDRAGIEFGILSLTSPGAQSVLDSREAAEVARLANVYAHSLNERYPDRLSAFATVSLRDAGAAARELERAVKTLALKGVLINGYTNVGPNEEVQYLDEAPLG